MNSVFTFLELGLGFLGPSPLLSASKKESLDIHLGFCLLRVLVLTQDKKLRAISEKAAYHSVWF